MPYIQNTPDDVREMLAKTGKKSVDDFFKHIPDSIKLKEKLGLPAPLSELELLDLLRKTDSSNASMDKFTCFLGAGAYNHFTPAMVEQLSSRGEFYTAYTPYQAEASQGMLQAFFEYQSLICELTRMDVSNASHYDGSTALAEAMLIATAQTEKKTVLLSSAIHPEYRQVVKTYLQHLDVEVREVPCKNGATDLAALDKITTQYDPACVAFQHPNFFGCLEEPQEIEKIAHKKGALLTAAVDPVSLGILNPPGSYNADVAIGEAQGLGNDVFFGGPYIGFLTVKNELVRRIPGRLVGQTVDKQGSRAFTLTLQTREQHIRRERASSNICTNEGLCALKTTFHLCALGKTGIKQVAELCCQKAHYLADCISKIKGFSHAYSTPFFKEFTIKCPKPAGEINSALLKHNIIGGFDLSRYYPEDKNLMLLCATEKVSKEQMDNFCAILKQNFA